MLVCVFSMITGCFSFNFALRYVRSVDIGSIAREEAAVDLTKVLLPPD